MSTIATLFEAAALARPDAVAVVCGQEELTYRELSSRSRRVARRLRGLGVGPETPVGLLMPRSIEMVIGLLGILLAGGAYLPLDPEHPASRILWMIEDAGADIVLTAGSLADAIGIGAERAVSIEAALEDEEGARETTSDREGAEADLAYIIYTSGSTGRPKGVEITNANVIRLFSATSPLFRFGADDVWSLCHSIAFDFSVWEIFGALLHGGRVVVVPRDIAREPRRLAELLRDQGVTMLSQTPSAFRELMPALVALNEPPPLRSIVFGGEALDPAQLRPWFERFGDEAPAMVNMFGITEITVHATYRRVLASDTTQKGQSPIGRPLPDLDIALCDAERMLVPQGEVGEIYVVGPGVARGYRGRPDLTAERFFVLPETGRRAYRSGDLARALSDGELIYLGRMDQQVKIRGHRVELGEIQSWLLEMEGVADAAVVCRHNGHNEELIAYVVPRAGYALSEAALRAEIARRAPSYMVPAAAVFLERLPLTVNGKLDTAALPLPDRDRAPRRAPATPTERALCYHIARAVGVEEIGLDDIFVRLGGHSLGAARVVRDLGSEEGLSISVEALLSDQTVAELCALIDRANESSLSAPQRPSRRAGHEARASAAQVAIWLHAQRYPGDAAYNETLTLSRRGAVDIALLERCLAEVVARHSSLRARFVWRSGALYQHIESPLTVPMVVEDLRGLPADERAAAARQLGEAQARRAFDLAAPPLLRATLACLDDEEIILYITVHHAICDAHSLSNLALELSELYDARSHRREPQLPSAALQYHDIADQFEAIEQASPSAPALPASTAPSLRLPVDFTSPAGASRESARCPVRVPKQLVASLRSAAAAEGATLFMLLLAAWQTLLYRYSRSPTGRVGIVATQRIRPELGPLIGPLFALVPIEANPRGDQPFTSLLASQREALLAVLGGGAPKTAMEITFETGFGMAPPSPLLAGGFQADFIDIGGGSSKLDLVAILQESADGGLHGYFEYRKTQRRPDAVERMVGHYMQILESVAAAPSLPLAEIGVLTQAEREQILSWGRCGEIGGAREPQSKCVHELVLARARIAGEAIAVESNEGALTYRQLVRRAGAIAAKLGALGVGPEARVAVCLRRSPDLITTLLGVLMAGGAFVPLDPTHPAERLLHLINDARPALIVTHSMLRDRFTDSTAAPLLCIDDEPMVEPADPEPVICGSVRPENLAYILYTSGSTGRPKGVEVEHRSLMNWIAVSVRAFGFAPESRVLQLARFTFDVSLMEIFCTLSAGGALILPAGDTPLVGADLIDALRERRITIAGVPASLLRTLPVEPLPALSTLVTGGEAVPSEVVDRWAGGRLFLNAYGPTEATVGVTFARCEPGQGRPPIGKPLDNIEVYVLDADRQLVPIGVPGELYIGGVCLARGYLNQPELTAASFVEAPPSLPSAGRLYRTGDRVCFRADGQLDFLGRIDRQIKLRGFRIEPAEIEAAVREHPGVQDAVVALIEEIPGHPTLCAYVIAGEPAGARISATPEDRLEVDIRRSLREKLPDFMIPSSVVRLDAFPLTAHGKVDIERLPPPRAQRSRASTEQSYRDALEAKIAAIWAEVLGIQEVRHDDNFFDLGGTSLLLAQAQERLSRSLGRSIPMPILFQRPTPRSLAERLRGGAEPAPRRDARTRAERLNHSSAAQSRPLTRALSPGQGGVSSRKRIGDG